MVEPILAPNSTWFTQGGTTVTRASITEIEIKDTYTPTGTVTSSWDASAAKDGSVMAYVEGTKLTLAGNGSGKIYANPDSSYAFSNSGSDRFTSLITFTGGNLLDTSKVTTFSRLFQYCLVLTYVDVSNWDTSNVESMQNTFSYCYALDNLNVANWNTENVLTMRRMFQCARSLTELNLSRWNVGKVTDMNGMFTSVYSDDPMALITIGDTTSWNTSSVTDMSYMFYSCTSLDELDVSNWETCTCTNMRSMFYECTSLNSLNVSNWDTGACTDMSYMFYHCSNLTELDVSNWDVSKVTSFSSMFSSNSFGTTPMTIQELDVSNWDTSSATDMSFMFYGCKGPKSIDTSNWDVSNVTNFDHMFAHSYLTIGDTKNWHVSTACTNLNAAFHSVQNTTLNVSNFDTSNVQFFCQMFQDCYKLVEIIGLENLDTSSGLGFDEMFRYCGSIKELNLSNFDTTKAKDGATASTNGHKTATLQYMFGSMNSLEKITLGEKFSFNGDGSTTNSVNVAVLPTPNASYISDADGYWYTQNRTAYLPADIPDRTVITCYASESIVNDLDYLIKNGSLLDIAEEIRVLSGIEDPMSLDDMNNAVHTENVNFESNLSTQDDLIAQIQAAVDSLPEADVSGTNVETCIGTVSEVADVLAETKLYYLDRNLTLQCIDLKTPQSFEVVKNSIICCEYGFFIDDGNAHEIIKGVATVNACCVISDFTIHIES